MAKCKAIYKSYLLRLWREDTAHGKWRVMVETITGESERHHFADLDGLIHFLLVEIENGRLPHKENYL